MTDFTIAIRDKVDPKTLSVYKSGPDKFYVYMHNNGRLVGRMMTLNTDQLCTWYSNL